MSEALTHARAVSLAVGQRLKCSEVPGLELHAKTTGKMWSLYYRFAGDQRRPKLGTFPSMRVEDARALARELLQQVARGIDPSAAKQALRDAPRMHDLWEQFEREHVAYKKSGHEDSRQWRNSLARRFGDRRVAEITLADVNAYLRPYAKRAPVAANRARALLHTLFEFAERQDVQMRPKHSNPVEDAHREPERARRRKVEAHEFERVGLELRRMAAERPRHVAAILVMLTAGTRVTELVRAPRAAFDGQARTITLDVHKTDRTGDARVIYLSRHAAELIASIPDDHSQLLFGPMDRWKVRAVWKEVVTRAGCPDLQTRDLRRTFASVAKSRGVSLDQIGELFSHATTQTTQGYAYLFADAATAAVEATSDEIVKRLGYDKAG